MTWSSLVSIEYTEILFSHWEALIFLFLVPFVFISGKYLFGLYMWLHHKDFNLTHELVEADNLAVCVALVGMEAGLGLTTWGALSDQDKTNNSKNLYGGIAWYFIGVVFMSIFFVFTDKFTLKSANITSQTKKGNIAAALCIASNFVSSGIVALYTIGGGVNRWDEAFGSAVLFFILCRVFLSVFHFGLMFIFRRFGGIEEEIRRGNVAAGVLIFTMQTGVSIFVTNPLRSSEEVLAFFLWCVIGAVAIVATDILMWLAIVTKDGTEEFAAGRWGGVFVEGCGVIAAALAIIPFLPNTCAYTAQLTMTLNERLASTETTKKLFQWPNLYYLVLIVLFLCLAKIIYVLPYLVKLPAAQWMLAVRFFLASPGDVTSICKTAPDSRRSPSGSQVPSSNNFVGQASTLFGAPTSGELTGEVSLSTGKVRGRKNHLLKEMSGHYASDAEGMPPPAPARELDDFELELTEDGTAPKAIGTSHQKNVKRSQKAGEGMGGLAEPLASEASIDFTSMVADEGATFAATARISESRAVSFGGLLLAIGCLLRASFATTIGSTVLGAHEIIMYTLFWIGMSITMLLVGTVVQSLLLWRRFAPPSRTNLASGIILFSLLISVALQASSSIMGNQGDGPFDLSVDVPQALVLFLIQMCLVGCSGWLYQRVTSYDDQKAVEEGNVAAAVANAGALIASALLASAPTTKTSELLTFVSYFAISSAFAHVSSHFMTRKLIFGNRSTDDEVAKDQNWGAAALEAIITIGTAYAYSALLPELCSATSSAPVNSVSNTTSLD